MKRYHRSKQRYNIVVNKDTKENEMAVVKGEARWASVHAPNTELDEPQWNIDLVIDEKTYKTLKKEGLTCVGTYKTKEDADEPHPDEGKHYFRAYRKVYRKGGGKNQAPLVVDAKRQPMGDLIGNGSVCKVQYRPWDWTFKKTKGTSADLVAVQVIDLVPYGIQAGAEFDEEDGYTSEDAPIVDENVNNAPDDDVPY